MPSRLTVALALSFAVTGARNAEAAPHSPAPATPARSAPESRDPAPLSPARERQKRCGIEWRALSVADRTAKGPNWPQFYSRCVKRLKDPKA